MFKISYIVDDKRLPDMLRGCSGHVYNLEVVPVANAEPVPLKGGPKPKALPAPKKVREQYSGSRNFIRELGWEKGLQFRGKDVSARLPSLGMKDTSAWYVVLSELKAGRVKRVSQGLYEVVVGSNG
jgi:hypothetical protein